MNIKDIVNKIIKEASSESGSRGSYILPMQLGLRKFKKDILAPFTDEVSHYDSPLLQYDSMDGKMDETPKQIKKIEGKAKKVTNYMTKHPLSTFSDDDGNGINPNPGKSKKLSIVPIKEADSSITAGLYNGPIELGLKNWKNNILAPFTEFVDTTFNHQKKQKTMKNNIKKVVGVWEKNSDGSYNTPEHDVHTVNEWIEVTNDLVVEDLYKSKRTQTESLHRLIKSVLRNSFR
jgi:hypothetical protein